MPYCNQCGKPVGGHDLYCGGCGAKQEVPAGGAGNPRGPVFHPNDFLGTMPPRTAALLCYIPLLGWVPAIFVLASARFRHERETRFHAFQGLYLFVAWLLVEWVLKPVTWASGAFLDFSVVGVAKIALFCAWIWMMVKVSQNETYKLPLFGDLAEKSVTEQH